MPCCLSIYGCVKKVVEMQQHQSLHLPRPSVKTTTWIMYFFIQEVHRLTIWYMCPAWKFVSQQLHICLLYELCGKNGRRVDCQQILRQEFEMPSWNQNIQCTNSVPGTFGAKSHSIAVVSITWEYGSWVAWKLWNNVQRKKQCTWPAMFSMFGQLNHSDMMSIPLSVCTKFGGDSVW